MDVRLWAAAAAAGASVSLLLRPARTAVVPRGDVAAVDRVGKEDRRRPRLCLLTLSRPFTPWASKRVGGGGGGQRTKTNGIR